MSRPTYRNTMSHLSSKVCIDSGGQLRVALDTGQGSDLDGRGWIQMIDQVLGAVVDHSLHLEPRGRHVHRLDLTGHHFHSDTGRGNKTGGCEATEGNKEIRMTKNGVEAGQGGGKKVFVKTTANKCNRAIGLNRVAKSATALTFPCRRS